MMIDRQRNQRISRTNERQCKIIDDYRSKLNRRLNTKNVHIKIREINWNQIGWHGKSLTERGDSKIPWWWFEIRKSTLFENSNRSSKRSWKSQWRCKAESLFLFPLCLSLSLIPSFSLTLPLYLSFRVPSFRVATRGVSSDDERKEKSGCNNSGPSNRSISSSSADFNSSGICSSLTPPQCTSHCGRRRLLHRSRILTPRKLPHP